VRGLGGISVDDSWGTALEWVSERYFPQGGNTIGVREGDKEEVMASKKRCGDAMRLLGLKKGEQSVEEKKMAQLFAKRGCAVIGGGQLNRGEKKRATRT